VRQTKATLSGQQATTPELRRAEEAISAGRELQGADPTKAIGYSLRGVELSANELKRHPRDSVALRDYDFALSRVFSVIHDAHLDPWTNPLQVPAPNGGQYLLTHRAIANRLWQTQDYE